MRSDAFETHAAFEKHSFEKHSFAGSGAGAGTPFQTPVHFQGDDASRFGERGGSRNTGPSPSSSGRFDVLVIEDEVETRDAMVDLLEREGYSALGAANGVEALALLKKEELPSLILLDLLMPVMDGWAFCRALNETPRLAGIPVAIVSATGRNRELPKRAQDAGLLRKPLDIRQLLRTVRSHCG